MPLVRGAGSGGHLLLADLAEEHHSTNQEMRRAPPMGMRDKDCSWILTRLMHSQSRKGRDIILWVEPLVGRKSPNELPELFPLCFVTFHGFKLNFIGSFPPEFWVIYNNFHVLGSHEWHAQEMLFNLSGNAGCGNSAVVKQTKSPYFISKEMGPNPDLDFKGRILSNLDLCCLMW